MNYLPPVPDPPKPLSHDVIERLNMQIVWLRHKKKPEEFVVIMVATPFGTCRPVRISADGPNLLCIETAKEGRTSIILVPAAQCAFAFELYVPSEAQPEQKVLIGFGATHDEPNA